MEPSALRPFCPAGSAAEAAFDGWRRRLEAQGVALTEADCYPLGVLAMAEARFEQLTLDLAACHDVELRLRIEPAVSRAQRDLAQALATAERIFAPRCIAEPVELPLAVGDGRVTRGGNVLAFDAVARQKDAVAERILRALPHGVRLTRDELRARVTGKNQAFLAALRTLTEGGRVKTSGQGRRGHPRLYYTEA